MNDLSYKTANPPAAMGAMHSVLQRKAIRQFIKFCIVGASSTVITFSVYAFLVYHLHLDKLMHNWLAGSPRLQELVTGYQLYVQVAAFAGWLFGVTNGFIWNSRWTFRQNDPDKRKSQYIKFVLVNVVGLLLNQTILFIVLQILIAGKTTSEKGMEPLIAFAVATGVVVFWNFFANKHWTFKMKEMS
jgi:putative flippase GtrA